MRMIRTTSEVMLPNGEEMGCARYKRRHVCLPRCRIHWRAARFYTGEDVQQK